ncbi:MAG TPA: GNAT family protein [Patescibacteria group bacterium]|nr:GNAT family protein [Patescibacteria group bacterium]
MMKYIGEHVYIRPLEAFDAEARLRLNQNNKDFFQTYTPKRDEAFYTLETQLKIIEEDMNQSKNDIRYSFGIFLNEIDELIGNVALTEVLRGPLQSCFIGYYLDEHQNGKGYMTEAVKLAVDFAFHELKLHRIEAGVMPHNIRSMRVLEKAGFHKEGIAVKNVKINGKWEDHQVLAIVGED